MIFWKQMLSDDRGEFDAAPVMVVLGTTGLLAISAYATVVNKQTFDALQVGGGCAAMISSLLASKWGDAKVRDATPPSVTTTTTTTATAPMPAPALSPPTENPLG